MKINNKYKFTVSLVLALFFWSFSCANYLLFNVSGKDAGFKIGYFITALAFSAVIMFLGGFKYKMNRKAELITGIAAYIISIFGAMNLSVLFADGFVGSVFLYIINVAFYLFFSGVALFVSGSMRVSAITALAVSYVYNVISFIIYTFRGSSLMPTDFMALGTAMNVASQYKFKLKYQLIAGTIMAIGHFMLAFKFPIKLKFKHKWWKMRVCGLLAAALCAGFIVSVDYSTYDVSVFDQHYANYEHGSAVGFYVNATKMGLKKTENYNPQTIDEKLLEYTANEVKLKDKPNIIVIMNESFADLRAVADFETNEEFLPFFKSLKKDTIKGEVLVSPFGGYTCNSEYEFLTGMNTGLLSSQSIPYMHMINEKMPYTLNTHMKELGYKVTAIHPYYENGWNRNIVYDYLGFDDFISIEDFFKMYDKNYYIRSYISDNWNYNTVLKHLEEKDDNEREFIFNITMQNHGGYEYGDFPAEIKLKGMKGKYPKTEQYLTCIKYSDMALELFLQQLKNFDEPVIVAMFGDHQPAVEEEFYEELYGSDLDDLSNEELERRYITPFMIWANFNIKEADNVKTSPSFLSNLIMEAANLPKSRVQLYLDELNQEVAQLNPLGYYDTQGQYRKHEDCEELERYYDIQYSLLNGENLNYDFTLYNRHYDVLGDYVLSPKYKFKDEVDAIIDEYHSRK